MLQIREISVVFGATEVLQAVSFGIGPGDGVALVGANGAGKTTLLRCLVGEMRPDAGKVVLNSGVKLAYLAQEEEFLFEGSAIERALSFEPDLLPLYRGIQTERYELIQDYSDRGGYVMEDLIRTCAENFGVADVLDTPYEHLSRGMRRKVDLVGMFSAEADLMVFDEPINFLDIQGITAFEEGVKAAKNRGQAVLVVSHDRELIDQMADQTLYLERGHLSMVRGGYSLALEHKERTFQAQVEKAAVLRKKIQSLQEAMRRRMGWGVQRENETIDSSSRRLAAKVMKSAKVMERRLERQKTELESEKPWIEKPVALQFPAYEVGRRQVVRLEDIYKTYGDQTVLGGLNLMLETRDRFALMGENGAGKTTLLDILVGRLDPGRGTFYLNPGVKIGYVTQGLAGFYEQPVFLHNFLHTGVSESEIRQFLGGAKLRRNQVLQPVETLSYGERMRGAIVKMILERVEFLVLDEPTTYLDIESIEVLESLLKAFPGGYIAVSHDRRFVSEVADEIWMLKAGGLERL